jgi:hypothetical protein
MKAGDILREAAELVDGNRAETYGDMAILHRKIAIMWEAWRKVRRDPDAPYNAEDVAHKETLKKMCRSQCGRGTRDNYTDAAAFQGIAGQLSSDEGEAER